MAISGHEIRRRFLAYFAEQQHTLVPSSSLVPFNDKTLLFTNAGMVQFKDIFTGQEKPAFTRAMSAQKCVRAGGKHNDLENVGVTARHHTFFEMLGNFSFGDYFKKEAIILAWNFITQELGLDKSRLTVTVFKGDPQFGKNGIPADDEAAHYWHTLCGVPTERIIQLGTKDNFWSMGDTGPCGPCSEIHYFQGDHLPCQEPRCLGVACDCDRYLEIWNLVFMQFERSADGTLSLLPKPAIDTGMGLERITAVANGLMSNYDTDLLLPIILRAATLCQKTYTHSQSPDDTSLRVLADHARATAFLMADGVFPSNEGRGYVLRRIMRRAIRHGERLGLNHAFFDQLTDEVIDMMSGIYKTLKEQQKAIKTWVINEEESFRRTLKSGLKILAQKIAIAKSEQLSLLRGDDIFLLYDTYGFPLDLTEIIIKEQGLSIDQAGFEQALEAQRARAGQFHAQGSDTHLLYKQWQQTYGPTTFLGYDLQEVQTPQGLKLQLAPWASIQTKAAWADKKTQHNLSFSAVESRVLVLRATKQPNIYDAVFEPTPFYGESGGQTGDQKGTIFDANKNPIALLRDTQKPAEGFHVSQIECMPNKTIQLNDIVYLGYDLEERFNKRLHHSATHLLHLALRHILGEHVKQAGSFVSYDRLRFDYHHFASLSDAQIERIEQHVQQRINQALPICTEILNFDDAKNKGAVALFDEKYGDQVRVLTIADSIELCGGTHAFNTKDIISLRILNEESIASGVRRIEAVVGPFAELIDQKRQRMMQYLASLLTASSTSIPMDPQDDESGICGFYAQVHAYIVNSHHELERTMQDWINGQEAKQLQEGGLPHSRLLIKLLQKLKETKAQDRAELMAQYQDTSTHPLVQACFKMLEEKSHLDKLKERQQEHALHTLYESLLPKLKIIHQTRLLTHLSQESLATEALRNLVDKLKQSQPDAVIIIACQGQDKSLADKGMIAIGVGTQLIKQLSAVNLIKQYGSIVGAKGGGKPDYAQAGASQLSAFNAFIFEIENLLGLLNRVT